MMVVFGRDFWQINGYPIVQAPNNLAFILNIDWFKHFKHIEYSIGVLYLVIANLPRSDCYKIENRIVAGIIPGPNERKKTRNSYLKPLVDELLEMWEGTCFKASGVLFQFAVQ